MDQSSKTLDPFGIHEKQAASYDIERPRYPKSFIDLIASQCKKTENFIDVATGTGILFFELIDKFSGKLVAQDISSKQLSVCREKVSDFPHKKSNINFLECDACEIPSKLYEPTKFDLVTVAQGLHWLDVEKFCTTVKDQLLSEEGIFVVTGYFCDGFEFNFPEDQNFAKSGQKFYDEYYKTVLPYFNCDRTALDQGHSEFDFKKIFKNNFERHDVEQRIEITMDRLVNYLRTYSAYNVYKKKHGEEEDYQDPMSKFEEGVKKLLEDYCSGKGIQAGENPIILKMHFFLLIMS